MSIATCPKCHRQVSLPTTDDHSLWVRCPLCGGQYMLRTALDHVPPSLEIVGPQGEQAGDGGFAPAEIHPFEDMQAGASLAFGDTAAQAAAPQGDMWAPGEMHPAADTLAHPDHGAVVLPFEAAHLQHNPDQSTEPHDDISEHLIDFELEHPPGQSDGGMIGHGEAIGTPPAVPGLPTAESHHGTPHIDDLMPINPDVSAFGDFHAEQHFTADSGDGDLPVDFMAEPASEPGSEHGGIGHAGTEHTHIEPMFEPSGEPMGSVAFGSPDISGEHPGEQHPASEPVAHEMFGGEQFAIEDFAGGHPAGEHTMGEHPAGDHAAGTHPAGDHAMGEDFGGEHLGSEPRGSEPLGGEHFREEPIAGEHLGEAEPEFQFAADDAPEHAEADTDEERAAMGGIATIVQAAPPAKKRRQAPMAVKLVGVLIAIVVGIVGCYVVLGAFLMAGNGEARGLASSLHLKPFYPGFVSSHIPDETTRSLRSTVPPKRNNPQTTTANGVAQTPGNTETSSPSGASTAPSGSPAPQTSPAPSTAATTPAKPGPSDVAQQSPSKSTGALETFDPNKTPPADSEKPDVSKPSSTPIAPPQLDAPKSPFDESPKTPATPVLNAAAPAAPTPNKLATKVSPSGPNATVATPTAPAEKTAEKPVIQSSEKSEENNPFAPPETKSPLADRLAEIDVAMNGVKQTVEGVESAAAPGADPLTALRAKAVYYRAMSHLATTLATIEHLPHNPNFAARIEKLRRNTATFAEVMGSPAERDTTALLAGKWIASPSRKENGVVIVGTLAKVDPSGQGFAAHVKLPDGSKEMTFTSATKPAVADGAAVVVLGVLDADKNGGMAVEIVPANEPAANPSTASGGSQPAK